MVQTAWGALNRELGVTSGDTLLIRGGTTSAGLTAAILAKWTGLRVIATTRREDWCQMLLKTGADEVLIEDGTLSPALRCVRRHRLHGRRGRQRMGTGPLQPDGCDSDGSQADRLVQRSRGFHRHAPARGDR
jgi:hypothetical protein